MMQSGVTFQPASLSEIASTVVSLAQFSLYAYGIKSAKDLLMHWLDRNPKPLFERRTPEQQITDMVRDAGIEIPEPGYFIRSYSTQGETHSNGNEVH